MEYPIAPHTSDALDLDQDDLALSAGGPVDSDDYICLWEQCFKTYDDPEQLYMHMTNDHVGRKSTNNLCLTCHWEKCDYTTAKRDHITSHLRVHVPLKPFACEECNKPFKRRQDLKKHERTHTEEHQATLRNPHHRGFQPIRQMHPNTPPQGTYSDRSPSLSSGILSPSQVPLSPPHSLHSDGILSDGTVPALSPYSETSDNFNVNHQALELNADDFANLSYMANGAKRGYSDLDSTEDSYSSGSNDVLDELFTEVLRNKKKPMYNQDMVNRLNNLSTLAENGQLNAHINSEEDLNDLNKWLGQLQTEITSGGYLDPNILDGASSDSDLSSVDFPMPGVKSANGAGLYPNIGLDGKPTNAALLGDFYNGNDMDVHIVYPQMGDYNAAQYGLGAGADMYQLDPSGGLYPGQKQMPRPDQPQVRQNQYVRSRSRYTTDRSVGAQSQLYDFDINGTVLYDFDQQTQGGINYPVSQIPGQYVGTTGVRRNAGPAPQIAANFWGPTLQYQSSQNKANETKANEEKLYKEFFRSPSPADIKRDPDQGIKMESPDIKVKSEPRDEDDDARRLLSSGVQVKLEQDEFVPIKIESPPTVAEKKGMMTLYSLATPPERNSPPVTTAPALQSGPASQEPTPTSTATATPPGGYKFKTPGGSRQMLFLKSPVIPTSTPATPTATPTATVTATATATASPTSVPAATLSPDATSNSTRSRSASASAILNGTVRNADDGAAVVAQLMQNVSLDDNDTRAKARRSVPAPTPRSSSADSSSSSPYPSIATIAGAARPAQPVVGVDVAMRRKHAQLVQHILRTVNAVYRTKQLELMQARSAVAKEEKDGWVMVDEVQRSVGHSAVVAGGDE